MKKLKVELVLTEECLGLCPPTKEMAEQWIASNAPDAQKMEEELAAYHNSVDPSPDSSDKVREILDRTMTIFMKDENGVPFFWDYQMRGFMKDQCAMLARAEGTLSSTSGLAFRKIIDGIVFVRPRRVAIQLPEGGKMGECHRVIRISGATGERTAIVASETVPAGSRLSFEIHYMPLRGAKVKAPTKTEIKNAAKAGLPVPQPKATGGVDIVALMREWFDHGEYRGLGQWRNSAKGTFTVETFEEI